MPLPKEELYTIGDIYSLPEGERAELIDGQIYDMAPPSRHHQEISMELSTAIQSYIRSKKGNCRVYAAPFAVQLDEDSHTYVEPDISVICDPNKLDERGCKGAPDWIIEIVSPGQQENGLLHQAFQVPDGRCRNIGLDRSVQKSDHRLRFRARRYGTVYVSGFHQGRDL